MKPRRLGRSMSASWCASWSSCSTSPCSCATWPRSRAISLDQPFDVGDARYHHVSDIAPEPAPAPAAIARFESLENPELWPSAAPRLRAQAALPSRNRDPKRAGSRQLLQGGTMTRAAGRHHHGQQAPTGRRCAMPPTRSTSSASPTRPRSCPPTARRSGSTTMPIRPRSAGSRPIIAGAGGAAHLPGMTASMTSLPGARRADRDPGAEGHG